MAATEDRLKLVSVLPHKMQVALYNPGAYDCRPCCRAERSCGRFAGPPLTLSPALPPSRLFRTGSESAHQYLDKPAGSVELQLNQFMKKKTHWKIAVLIPFYSSLWVIRIKIQTDKCDCHAASALLGPNTHASDGDFVMTMK
ncbi:Uncharacterized protein DAT39_002903 [Clarias magur]|uniref:Uncharacterized protein n=1 Tax=Clarias magur TaxID=1594786 RepID=A0A8J4UNU6_CLAMG|nr:Uncharacterized protein DAT39_002903 [Clarias magur]